MQSWSSCLLVCWLVHAAFAQASSGDGLIAPIDAVPATCRAGPHIVMGTPLKWQLTTTGELVDGGNCTFTDQDSQQLLYSAGFVAALPGDYRYQCPEVGVQGNMSIVQAQYSIAVCSGCSNYSNEYRLNTGEVLQWTFVRMEGERLREAVNCTSQVWRDDQLLTSMDQFMTSYQFNSPGNYLVTCERDTSLQAAVIVMGTPSPPLQNNLLPLLYTHAALMATAFGVLLPIGAFLAYNKVKLAHKIVQPLGIMLALIGFVLVIVFVQFTHGKHFRYLIHSLLGLVLLLLATLVMPLLLLRKPRTWHKKTGQIVTFFGMGNVLLGLSVFPVLPLAAYIICAAYGVWLVVAAVVYIFVPRSTKKVSSYSIPSQTSKEPKDEIALKSRNSSFSSLKGPQRLDKNVISDEKMIQLRKKSMDFLDSTRTREQLNLEFQHHPLYNNTPYENGHYKPDQESDSESYDLETSQAPLCRMVSEQDSSMPPTPDDELGTNEKVRMYLASSEQPDRVQSADDLDQSSTSPDDVVIVGGKVTRAKTFNHHYAHLADDETEKGGSLRITRHSKRARVDDVFPTILTPDDTDKATTLPVHLATTPQGEPHISRRRKGAFMPPPIITTTPVDGTDFAPTGGGCPFHSMGSMGSGLAVKKSSRRGISPTPSGDSTTFESSPRPQRKKKVSVAQIEATVVPPTPVNLMPPAGGSLSGGGIPHSISHDTLRTTQDVFTDNAFRSVMHISQDAIVCANSVGDIVFWSAGAARMFGYTPGEAIGSNLEMIVPLSFREKHRGGINHRTTDTLKYLKKHSYAPEEQKHARLYEVRALTKSGHEIPAEVHVTSFVIEGELFYTGVITEMTRKTGGSIGSTSDINELSLKQRALAVGAQMKIAHNLMNAAHISKKELERVLVSSLRATDFKVEPYQIEQMVAGIMKEGDLGSTGVMPFVSLIKLLSKHQLYISESGNIARYGKTKGTQGGDSSRRERVSSSIKEFFVNSAGSLFWLLIYVLLNIFVFVVGVVSTDRLGVEKFAYGAGPVLSMNTVLVLLPTLSSVVTAMRSSVWMNKYLPLTRTTLMHVLVSCGILVWSLVHVTLHFVSFAVTTNNATAPLSTSERFAKNLLTHLGPTITGFIIALLFLTLALSSIGPIRRVLRFIPFYIIHWVCLCVFYLLLVIHGVGYFNHSYWPWLLPFALVVLVERVYRYTAITRHSVRVDCAGRYDDQSRTAIIELERPPKFKFEPGQYMLLNLPWIGYFNWQPCQISSGPKDKKLTVHIPYSTEPWTMKTFQYLKTHPYHMHSSTNQRKDTRLKNKEAVTMESPEQHPADLSAIQFTGPHGPVHHSQLLFDHKISSLVCAGESGPHVAKAIIKRFLEYRKGSSCHCGCSPVLTKLYIVWVVPSGHDFEWFTDYLSELCEDDHVHRYLDVRVFLTNINSPPDELASALLQLGLKTAGPQCIVRRPSQPQLNNLHSKTSYGAPDFPALLDYISAQNATMWSEGLTEFGVFSVGALHHGMRRDLARACKTSSKPGQLIYSSHHIYT